MDELLTKIIQGVVDLGGPGALVGALFLVLFILERRKVDALNEKFVALTRETVQAVAEGASASERLAEHGDELRDSITKIAEAVTIISARGRRG